MNGDATGRTVPVVESDARGEAYPAQSEIGPPATGKQSNASRMGRLLRGIPALLVFALLGGMMWWGHTNHWTIPSFEHMAGAEPAAKEPWCEEHHMPLKDCIACNADLMPKGHDPGWCKQHGVHYCVLCHPELAQAAKPPTPLELTADMIRATRALGLRARQSNNPNCQLHNRRIQFCTIQDAEKIGVFSEPVWRGEIEEAVSGPGEINYDETRVARISTPSGGTVYRALKQQGEEVQKGDLLALIDSREVGEARAQFMQALIQARLQTQIVERLKSAAAQGGVAGRDLAMAERDAVEARMQLASAQQALANLRLIVNAAAFEGLSEAELAARLPWLGLSDDLVVTLKAETSSANLLPVFSPFNGVVIRRDLVAGDVITSSHVMFVVADPSQLWLDLNLSPKDARLVKPGCQVRLKPDTGDEIAGTVDWIAPEADEITRTVHLRA
ncbi:MAG: efflux RND transporter periplasmic adaptor subunit, partial [Planctomycetota bacterium]